ncbi:DNA-directed RNA polymerase III subunit RPC6 [Fopius arisanus]|uniref:DNA-directed RNA polymerase III subunit RPC6 n=1 Tax=Fopius arisanus TaxID=64838 RepID=A0A9R1T5Z3_9HYME|nr:PREDICTED: DNA-directed RNA polymerase III subunit RPC6 [Fopius arisanus]
MESEDVDDPQPGTSISRNADSIEQKIIDLAQVTPNGLTDADISREYPNLEPAQKALALNKLLKQGQIVVLKKGTSLLYRLKASTTKGADNEERIVYSIIEAAGNKGIWSRDVRWKANLPVTQTGKIIKSLESKKLIKPVKSVAAGRKVVYMLYNLEPDRSVTGGAWYQDQDFEAEFVDVLNQQCYRFLELKREEMKTVRGGPIIARNVTFASSKEVWQFISDLGISKVNLSVEDLEMILNTLVYDGKVERTVSADGDTIYRAITSIVTTPGLILTPCGMCPVRKNCCDLGDVTPLKCQYLTDWLDASQYKKIE